jgi:ATP-dependent DNA helicase RecG
MAPTAFATSRPLDSSELESAPTRYPRPLLLAAPLELPGARATKAAGALGLHTIGDLLSHLPRDRRTARSVGELQPDEIATVVVEVRSIASRSVRRRGCARWSRPRSATTPG